MIIRGLEVLIIDNNKTIDIRLMNNSYVFKKGEMMRCAANDKINLNDFIKKTIEYIIQNKMNYDN